MSIDFDKVFGIHEAALGLRGRRAEVLASNLANADTPGYKARDIDFKAVLHGVQAGEAGMALKTTHTGHIHQGTAGGAELQYRIPQQPSIDGNTVDSQVEKAEFTQNALQYQASLTFIEGRLKGLLSAIKGG